MEEEPQKLEVAESKPKKVKSVNITRVRKPSEGDNEEDKLWQVYKSNEITDTHFNVKYERRTKHQVESRGSRVVEHKQILITEELELPKNRSIKDDTTNKDIPPKVRRVQPRRSSITPTVPISKPAVERKKTQVKPVTKKTNLKQNISSPTVPQQQFDNILIRTSPKPLFDTLHSLSNPHKQYMCEIGLCDLLDNTVDGIPSHIGFYVVSNFDCQNMVLIVSGGQLRVNRQVVHHLLGLPLGDRNILSLTSNDRHDDTIDQWKDQFKFENEIRPKGIQKMMFRVNTLVLICNTLGQSIEDKISVASAKFPNEPTFKELKQKFKTLSEHMSSDSEAENKDEFPDSEAARSPNTEATQNLGNQDGNELSQWSTKPETLQEIDKTLALVK
ncbi:hypothetical protein L1887_11871 [Cichorium endivia]|nr:hypothetical protein L1887_11871 [Cichorium endivia]